MADLEAVCRQAAVGGVQDEALIRRITERAEQVRREVLEKHGVLHIAVDLIREIRDEE